MEINGENYIPGVFRGDNGNKQVTHLYKGSYANPGFPMCSRGWQRKYYNDKGELDDWEYSIFRNNISEAGICKVCLRRAEKNLPPFSQPFKLELKTE